MRSSNLTQLGSLAFVVAASLAASPAMAQPMPTKVPNRPYLRQTEVWEAGISTDTLLAEAPDNHPVKVALSLLANVVPIQPHASVFAKAGFLLQSGSATGQRIKAWTETGVNASVTQREDSLINVVPRAYAEASYTAIGQSMICVLTGNCSGAPSPPSFRARVEVYDQDGNLIVNPVAVKRTTEISETMRPSTIILARSGQFNVAGLEVNYWLNGMVEPSAAFSVTPVRAVASASVKPRLTFRTAVYGKMPVHVPAPVDTNVDFSGSLSGTFNVLGDTVIQAKSGVEPTLIDGSWTFCADAGATFSVARALTGNVNGEFDPPELPLVKVDPIKFDREIGDGISRTETIAMPQKCL